MKNYVIFEFEMADLKGQNVFRIFAIHKNCIFLLSATQRFFTLLLKSNMADKLFSIFGTRVAYQERIPYLGLSDYLRSCLKTNLLKGRVKDLRLISS